MLREQTGDPNQLGDVREDVLVVIALLARDFGGRNLLAPTPHYLAELADMGLSPDARRPGVGDSFDRCRTTASMKKPGSAGLLECPRKESNLEPSD